ncbi:MAG: hypothetical protein LKG27_05595 [Clostridiaceae bacterium]|nr:hypothetical protein [Clostridiaceae bacterium]
MKNNDKIEEMLLTGKSLDELIRLKMQQELEDEISSAQTVHEKYVEVDISKVPKELIFSKKAVFKVFNKTLKTESFITGVQADGLLGLQNSIRTQILNGELSVFMCDDAFVKFEKIELEK